MEARSKPNWSKRASAVFVLCAATALALPAQTLTTLYSFNNGTNGYNPMAGLVQATNGDLYGTTFDAEGTVFKITPSGTLTTLYNFCSQSGCADGANPEAGLIQATNGDLYGTTYAGGSYTAGTVFKMTPGGALTTLFTFDGADGVWPFAGLVQAASGDLYGTTVHGGSCTGPGGCGTVFKMTPAGKLTTLYNFCSQSLCADGVSPYGGLVQVTDGNFYGTTLSGGANCYPGGCGTIFKMTPTGMLTTLYSFCSQVSGVACTDGAEPQAGLVQGTDGNFDGTTAYGGSSDACDQGCGTIFKITPTGTLTTLYSFCSQAGCTDGRTPFSGLVQAADGNFYGTTYFGGANGDGGDAGAGTVFKMTPGGTLTTLYNFCSQSGCTDGTNPSAGLVQDTNGKFYGTTEYGGTACAPDGCGTLFSLSTGLGAFVETQTESGKVGAPVKILGTNLKGATSVTFDGTPAAFTIVSASEITTTVPNGATTGTVQVVTPRATLSTNVPFRVLP
jgi:uncharacterized repeat protein (TIGR03803 family)